MHVEFLGIAATNAGSETTPHSGAAVGRYVIPIVREEVAERDAERDAERAARGTLAVVR
ncbi:hypothetical protein KV205_25735 [Streptomyces sp. SKN60]|uniref:hypothetical protein n=1 Tax=Streptomyces sp. SKN60 TaxID=2855506 RepID=UPI00224521D5|nr:hypothetical protein [Streptomyces sp. SKN60]MCX2183907.1 hypothetical protein [Streptomyces sp. SKN60]